MWFVLKRIIVMWLQMIIAQSKPVTTGTGANWNLSRCQIYHQCLWYAIPGVHRPVKPLLFIKSFITSESKLSEQFLHFLAGPDIQHFGWNPLPGSRSGRLRRLQFLFSYIQTPAGQLFQQRRHWNRRRWGEQWNTWQTRRLLARFWHSLYFKFSALFLRCGLERLYNSVGSVNTEALIPRPAVFCAALVHVFL